MRRISVLLPLAVLVAACTPALLPEVGRISDRPRVSLHDSALTVSLDAGWMLQTFPAAWDEAVIELDSHALKQKLSSGPIPRGQGPVQHQFAVPPSEVTIMATLRLKGLTVAMGEAYAALKPGPNTISIELTPLLTTVGRFAGGGKFGGDLGADDGPGPLARFESPRAMARDTEGNLYVADYGNGRIRRIDPHGNVSTLAGSVSGHADGSGGAAGTAKFMNPSGLAYVAATHTLYVSDAGSHVIRAIDLSLPPEDPGFVTTLAGQAESPGFLDAAQGSEAKFKSPEGLAWAPAGYLVVADSMNHMLRRIDPHGMVSTIAGQGGASTEDGDVSNVQLNYPSGVAVDANNQIYFTERGGHRVRRLSGTYVLTLAGGGASGFESGGELGSGVWSQAETPYGTARFDDPTGIIWVPGGSPAGNLYVTDTSNHRICRIDLGRPHEDGSFVTLFLGAGIGGSVEGTDVTARFLGPRGLIQGLTGEFYVSDTGNHRIMRAILGGYFPGNP